MEDGKKEDAKSKLRKRERLKDQSEFELYRKYLGKVERAIVYSREKSMQRAFEKKFKPGFVPMGNTTGAISLVDIVARKDCEELIENNSNIRKY